MKYFFFAHNGQAYAAHKGHMLKVTHPGQSLMSAIALLELHGLFFGIQQNKTVGNNFSAFAVF